MSHIIVVGGGLIGLATGLMLVKSGHEITVLERDQAPPPENAQEAWGDWERNGVGQFRQPHYLLPRGRQILDAQLPAVTQALIDVDAASHNPITVMPPGITDRSPRPADEKFTTINARRPVLEYAVASMARDTIDVRRGVHVTGLLSDRPGHVSGVRTADSGDLRADLVIDAMGRRSPLPMWLAAIGAGQPAEETSQTPIAYYSRFFQAPAGEQPPPFRAPVTTRFDCYALITLPGDAGSWSVMIALSAHDQALKALREEANWAKLVSSCPLHENLIAGPPITGVVASGGNADRLRSLVVDAKPVATGIYSWSAIRGPPPTPRSPEASRSGSCRPRSPPKPSANTWRIRTPSRSSMTG